MNDIIELRPLLVSTTTAKQLLSIGNTRFWHLVKTGKIRLVDMGVGARQMVDYRSLLAIADTGLHPQSTSTLTQ